MITAVKPRLRTAGLSAHSAESQPAGRKGDKKRENGNCVYKTTTAPTVGHNHELQSTTGRGCQLSTTYEPQLGSFAAPCRQGLSTHYLQGVPCQSSDSAEYDGAVVNAI
jgi:hypothetical protein